MKHVILQTVVETSEFIREREKYIEVYQKQLIELCIEVINNE